MPVLKLNSIEVIFTFQNRVRNNFKDVPEVALRR